MALVKLPHAVIRLSVSVETAIEYIHNLRPICLSSTSDNMGKIASRVEVIKREVKQALADLEELSGFLDTLREELEENLEPDLLQRTQGDIEAMKRYEENLLADNGSRNLGRKIILQILRMSNYGRNPVEGAISIPSEVLDETWDAIGYFGEIIIPGSRIEAYPEPDNHVIIEFFPTDSLYWAYSSLRKRIQHLSLYLELAAERIQKLSSLLSTSSMEAIREEIQSHHHFLNLESALKEAKRRMFDFLEGSLRERLEEEKDICLYI